MHQHENDPNLVEMWANPDPMRLLAGALAGALACVVAIVFGMILSKGMGYEIWFPVKVAALPVLGPYATEYGMNMKSILTGFIFAEIICMFWGAVYAHFTGTNKFIPLFGMGFVWGTFSWIFLNNLYGPSFNAYKWAEVSKGAMFFVTLAFGFSLTSVSIFDKILRGPRASA